MKNLQIFSKKKDVHKIHEENILIREIVNVPLEAEDNTTQLYYSIAHPNFNCRFIFDHSLDHYPFMLLLELGRQVTIGITHVYKNIPVESIKNTINAFNFKIHNFIELDYPLIIGCIDTVVKENKHMQIRNLEYLYVQGDKVCAELSSQVQIMSNRIYNIFRVKDRKMLTKKRALITNLDLLNR